MSRWVEFRDTDTPVERKTKVWGVFSKDSGVPLGRISWWPTWRQYTFFPCTNTLYNSECLSDIAAFVSDANTEHKRQKYLKELDAAKVSGEQAQSSG